MHSPEEIRRKDAIKALINIAIIEGFVLAAVVGVYLYTGDIVHLVGGVIGSALIFGPMILRWYNEYGGTLRKNGRI